MGIGGEDGEGVGGRDIAMAADDEVAVAISVRGRAKVGRVRRHKPVIEPFGMHQVGIGMVMTKVGQWGAVHHGAGRRTEATLENLGRIGSGHRAHGVERHGEASGDQRMDSPEVE